MPTINSMAQLRAASQAQAGFVRIAKDDTELTTSTTKARFWQFSRRALEKRENQAAAERVRDSVCAHCGKEMGTILFNKYIGEKSLQGANFTSTSLKKLLNAATRYNAAYLGQRLKDFAKGASLTPEIEQELARSGTDKDTFLRTMREAVEILEGDFFSDTAFAEAKTSLDTVRNTLTQMHGALSAFQSQQPQDAPGVPHLLNCINSLMGELATKADILVAQQEQNPFSGKNVRMAFKQIYEAYELVIRQHIDQLAQSRASASPDQALRLSSTEAALTDLLDKVKSCKDAPPDMQNVADDATVTTATMDKFHELPGTLSSELKALLPNSSSGKLAKELKTALVRVLNGEVPNEDGHIEEKWKVIQRDVQYLSQTGKSVTAKSTITPARHIGTIGQSMARDNLQGVSCGDRGQTKHAVNLASTEISVDGTTLFQGIRHGVNSAYTVKNTEQRLQANKTRAQEIFSAAVQSSPRLMQLAQTAKEGDVIDLPLLSTSLLTPDVWRRSGSGVERKYLAEQCNSWQDACQNGLCQITVATSEGDKTITVRPRVLTFNFGVNSGAQNIGKSLFGGWSTSTRYNEQAMDMLFGPGPNRRGGMVTQFLSRHDVSTKDKEMVLALRAQILELWNYEDFKTFGGDPYRLPARLALLAHTMGIMPLFNCKSGKDRTGQMDVACKTLALQIHERGGKLPPLDMPPTRVDSHIFHQVAINGGNFEMQRMNTGLAGFKTPGVWGLNRLFSKDARLMHRGFSRYVEV